MSRRWSRPWRLRELLDTDPGVPARIEERMLAAVRAGMDQRVAIREATEELEAQSDALERAVDERRRQVH